MRHEIFQKALITLINLLSQPTNHQVPDIFLTSSCNFCAKRIFDGKEQNTYISICCGLVTPCGVADPVNIKSRSGNGLLLFDAEPLPELMQAFCHTGPWNSKQNAWILVQEHAFENINCKMSVILLASILLSHFVGLNFVKKDKYLPILMYVAYRPGTFQSFIFPFPYQYTWMESPVL